MYLCNETVFLFGDIESRTNIHVHPAYRYVSYTSQYNKLKQKAARFLDKSLDKICENPVFMRLSRLLCYYTASIYSTNYSCCFHIFTPFLYSEMCQKPSIYAGFRDLLVYSNYTSPKPILPLFSFVPVGHKGLEDLGRVVVFVLC